VLQHKVTQHAGVTTSSPAWLIFYALFTHTPLWTLCRSFHHAGMLMPTLEACCGQLLAAAGAAPFNPAREALLMTCCKTVLEVMASRSYSGKVACVGAPEQVRSVGSSRSGRRCCCKQTGAGALAAAPAAGQSCISTSSDVCPLHAWLYWLLRGSWATHTSTVIAAATPSINTRHCSWEQQHPR
jgi:hypothetical protein